ncbi:MAG: hypothetical protein O9293_14090 [Porphyrobacter sp.]|nr:hypothetical protein [Porphyrobacter sp.]
MQMLGRNPAAAYRRVALEARIEASGSADLTRICLDEAQAALGHALIALERAQTPPREALLRAQTIMLWLARSVAPDHPLGASLKAFYGGLAGQIGAQILQTEAGKVREIQKDISDMLTAAG